MKDLAPFYRTALLDDVVPFWMRHGPDRAHGGLFTALARDGALLDTDKSVWFQGRAAWMFATLFLTVERRPEWLALAASCLDFLDRHGASPEGKLYFTLTREGAPLRMRRYVYSESFAAIGCAAYAAAAGDARAAEKAERYFAAYLHHSFTPGVMAPKWEPSRPAKGVGPLMIGIATAQELRSHLGDVSVRGRTCTEWIDSWIREIARDFFRPEDGVLLETVTPDGALIDHFDGRMINPGHGIEAAWFILHEGRLRDDRTMIALGLAILDGMWERGWDPEYGGLFYFRDVRGLPVQEYWHDMKFWWPHNEALIGTLLAWKVDGGERWKIRHRMVHDWSFRHFADPEYGEWFGYLHRDGSPSVTLKGNMWKGPFHLPRALWYCARLCGESSGPATEVSPA